MALALEDNFLDIISKAQRGLGISEDELARRAGISTADLEQLRRRPDESTVRKIAPVLGLNADALFESARKVWQPQQIRFNGLAAFTTPFHNMNVNSYLVWDSDSGEAAAFDTGGDAGEMLDFARRRDLSIVLILLTHTHGDHIFDLDRLAARTGATAYVGEREAIAGAVTFAEGKEFQLGKLRIETRLTSGHSRGGITYVVHGLERQVAVVGDAIFAGSMGGGMVSFEEALRNNREKIMTLPDDTVICPGHGPTTTVGEEKKHNPFLAIV